MKAMLFAAGLGTRLKPFTDKHPKALAPVNGKPLLEHCIRYLQKYGIKDVVVNVHHFADQIEQVLADNNGWGSNITISDERGEVLETGGGLLKAAKHFKDEECFVVINVDVLTDLDLGKMIAAHKASNNIATLAVMRRNSSRHLLFNNGMKLYGWQNNKTSEQKIVHNEPDLEGFAFSGVHVLSPEILDMPFEGKFSIIDVYLHFAKTHNILGYDHTEDVFLDVGKPESLKEASLFLDEIGANELTSKLVPSELTNNLFRRSTLKIQEYSTNKKGIKLIFELIKQDGNNDVWELNAHGHVDHKLHHTSSEAFSIYDHHPLLLEHIEESISLYIGSGTNDTNQLMHDLYVVHIDMVQDIIPVEKYISSYLHYQSESKRGLFAQGPKSILQGYKEVLDKHGIINNFLEPIKPKNTGKLLLKFEDSYIIAKEFTFKRIG